MIIFLMMTEYNTIFGYISLRAVLYMKYPSTGYTLVLILNSI